MPKPRQSLPVRPNTGLTNEELMILLKMPSSTFYLYKKIVRIPKGHSLNSWQHVYRFYRAYKWLRVERELQKKKPPGIKSRTYLKNLRRILTEEATNRNKIKDQQHRNAYDLLAQDLSEKGVDILKEFNRFKAIAAEKITAHRLSQTKIKSIHTIKEER